MEKHPSLLSLTKYYTVYSMARVQNISNMFLETDNGNDIF